MSIDHNSSSVHTYLSLLQGVISRMAGNGAACKTWCLTLATATVVFGVNGDNRIIALAFLPIGVFFLLDAYYLSLERDFRKMYNGFVSEIHKQVADEAKLFELKPTGGWSYRGRATARAFGSPSILPFYVILVIAVLAIASAVSNPTVSGGFRP